jgi:pimeloyl-ACP methyl ester carboxylesterase
VILVHSQGGNFAFNSALKYPDKVKAIVAVETPGSPDPGKTDFSKIKGIPMLWVWCDNLGMYPFWAGITARRDKFRENLARAGGVAYKLLLPEAGVIGNSHVMMMDQNSDQVAGLTQPWLIK